MKSLIQEVHQRRSSIINEHRTRNQLERRKQTANSCRIRYALRFITLLLQRSFPSSSFMLMCALLRLIQPNRTMNKKTSHGCQPGQPKSKTPSYQPSLRGLQEQALLHRICAEVMGSSTSRHILVMPVAKKETSSTSWVHREKVLEILDGALCILEDPLPRDDTPLSYKQPQAAKK